MFGTMWHFIKETIIGNLEEDFSIQAILWKSIKWFVKRVCNSWYQKRKDFLTLIWLFIGVRFLSFMQSIGIYKPSPKAQLTITVIVICIAVILALDKMDKLKQNRQILIKNI